MCDRAKLPDDVSERKLDLEIDFDEAGDYRPRWNAAPASQLPVIVTQDGAGTLTMMRRGLVPSWVKNPRIGHATLTPAPKASTPVRLSAAPGRQAAAASLSPTAITSGAPLIGNHSL